MKKKIWISLLAIILVVGAFFVFQANDFFQGTKGAKEIFVTVTNADANESLLERTAFQTDAETLGDFLAENQDELGVVMEDSEYGRFVTMVKDLASTDNTNGPWWMYAFKSPSKNLDMKVGEAPGVDQVGLSDQDEVEFVFTKDIGF